MKYDKRKHKYVYNYDKKNGHIMWIGAETTMCGLNRQKHDLHRMYVNWIPEEPLCPKCQLVLKEWLAKEYGIDGWAT